MASERPVFLVGFMGAGKTTLGKKLATKMKRPLVDLDDKVASVNGFATVKDLVAEKGMDFFREEERRVLNSADFGSAIVATGGGTPCYFDNMQRMKMLGTVVYIEVAEEVLFSRLKTTDFSTRPLLQGMNEQDLRTFINSKLKERLPYYLQAHLVFNSVNSPLLQLIQKLELLEG